MSRSQKLVAAGVALAVVLGLVSWWAWPKQTPSRGGETLTPAQARQLPGKEVTVEMAVRSAHKTRTGLLLLNSSASYKGPDNLTLAVDPAVGLTEAVVGRTVIVTGVVTEYKGRPEIKVTDPSQIAFKKE
jgi:hypothetical protein